MAGFTAAAAAGHFAVDQATGAQLVRSLSQMQEELRTVLRNAQQLNRATPLGDLPEAVAVSGLNQRVAAGDPASLVEVLRQFEESLEQVNQAVQLGMANYQQVDEDIRLAYERGLQESGDRGGKVGGTVSGGEGQWV